MPVRLVKEWSVEEMEPPVAISENGRVALVASGIRNGIDYIEVPTGNKTRSMEGHSSSVTALAIAPDGLSAASGAEDGEIRLWQLALGKVTAVLSSHSKRVTALQFSNNGKFMLSGSWDNTCRLWDVGTSRNVAIFKGHTGGVTGVAIAPDGKTAASSSFDSRVRVWEMNSGKCLAELPGHKGKVMCVSISKTGRILVAGDAQGYLSICDLPPKQLRIVGPLARSIGSVQLSKDGTKAYVGLSGGGFWSFDIRKQKAQKLFDLTGRLPAELPFGIHFAISQGAGYMVAARAASAAIVELERPKSLLRFFRRG